MDTPNSPNGANSENTESGFQERIMRQINELGEVLERAGNSISGKGWETIGNAIHKLGDTLEHLDIKIETNKKTSSRIGPKNLSMSDMSDESDHILGQSKNPTPVGASLNPGENAQKESKSYAGATRTDHFDVKSPASSMESTYSSVGSSKTADSLQSKTTQPKASDSQAY